MNAISWGSGVFCPRATGTRSLKAASVVPVGIHRRSASRHNPLVSARVAGGNRLGSPAMTVVAVWRAWSLRLTACLWGMRPRGRLCTAGGRAG